MFTFVKSYYINIHISNKKNMRIDFLKEAEPQAFSLRYTKLYSIGPGGRTQEMHLKEKIQKWLMGSFNDPIMKLLIENSHLTKTQLETFLIDILAENISGKMLKYDEKSKLRLLKGGVSRGAFNRTLRQARKNVIESIYTVLLLGYLGVFESTSLDLYVEVANKLQNYISAYRDVWKDKESMSEQLRIMNMLREELENSLQRLSKPKSLSKRL